MFYHVIIHLLDIFICVTYTISILCAASENNKQLEKILVVDLFRFLSFSYVFFPK